jgi:hypothetical protein
MLLVEVLRVRSLLKEETVLVLYQVPIYQGTEQVVEVLRLPQYPRSTREARAELTVEVVVVAVLELQPSQGVEALVVRVLQVLFWSLLISKESKWLSL